VTAAGETGRLCVGLISGTSADGIDAALVRIAAAAPRVELIAFESSPYPPHVRDELMALYDPAASNAVARLCSLNVVVGDLFASAALGVCRQAGIAADQVWVIGSHGQTVWHQPATDPLLPLSVPSTLQIGEPAVIAERTGAPVVADFRTADMAAGGQGAPLVPYFDWAVLRDPARTRAVQNIGGIGNVTCLPAGGDLASVRAFDTGPGNMVIDALVTLLTGGAQTYDRDGRLATGGRVDGDLLERLLREPYFETAPPKTTGREEFGMPYARRLMEGYGLAAGSLAPEGGATEAERARVRNLIATATALTARSIADAYRRWLPAIDEAIVSGGGSRNPVLMAMLADLLAPVPVLTLDALGIDGRAKEAMAFALMAHDALMGCPTNVPGATGARRAVPLGKLVPPGRRADPLA
jgi:anhydro-N-acetylmuramic acid kinase